MSDNLIRWPRVRLTVNGIFTAGCMMAEIAASRGSHATTFRIEAGADTLAASLGATWVDQSAIDVGIDMAFASPSASQPSSWTPMVSGTVDRLALDPVSGLVVLDGRDYAARLIDLPLQTAYLNQTAADVARALAAQVGLTADVDDTSGMIGQYYQIQHSKTTFGAYSRHANGWDLLCELAQIENYELWVEGTTLHFRKPAEDDRPFSVTVDRDGVAGIVLTTAMNAISLERSVGLSGPVQVQVSSWNSRQKQAVTASWPEDVQTGARVFTMLKPNLLPDQAQLLAQSSYQQLRARQRTLSGSMPGELTLAPRRGLVLSGTGTGWDATYTIDRITRSFSIDAGYTQHLVAVSQQDDADE